MGVIKEKIPITYFEKIKSAIDVLYPGFFSEQTPNVEKLKEKLNEDRDYSKLKRSKLEEMVTVIKKLHYHHLATTKPGLAHIENALEYLKRKQGGETLKGQEALEFLDLLWLSNSPHRTDENGKLAHIDGYTVDHSNDRSFWTFHRFNKYGKKTFKVEEQLTQEMFLTEVTNVDSDFLRLPFPCICIYLPFNDKLTFRKELIRYIYISERIIVGGDSDNKRILECIYVSKEEHITAQQYEIGSGKLIEQIEDQIHKLYESPLAVKESTEMISLVLALLLYTNSADSQQQQIFPLFFHKKIDSKFPVCSLGYGIKIDKGLHYSQNPETSGLGKPMNVLKWTVRGHFRTYRKGDHWKEDKTIWIRPFIKGRERDNPEQIIKPTNYIVD